MYIYPGIYLTAEENPRKPQLGDRLMNEGCAISHRLKWGPLPANEVGNHTEPQRRKIKEGKEG